jgi:hypothetical protein
MMRVLMLNLLAVKTIETVVYINSIITSFAQVRYKSAVQRTCSE